MVEGQDFDICSKPDHVTEAEAKSPNATVPGRWVDDGDLRVGDQRLLQDGGQVPIDELLVRQAEEIVYNIAVDGLHNYAVGPHGVLAHNMCGDAASRTLSPKVADAASAAEKFLGPNAKAFRNASGDLIVESSDGLRQIRFDFLHPSPHYNPHTHVQVFRTFKNVKIPVSDQRIYPIEFLPF